MPLERRRGSIPPRILKVLQEKQSQEQNRRHADAKNTAPILARDKLATPSDGAQPFDTCLDEVRPKAFTVTKDPALCTDPQLLRGGALSRYGDLSIQTSTQFVNQWQSKYTSMVHPFVIPRMVSGPDYDPNNPWRHKFHDAATVTPTEFLRGMARNCLAQVRQDFKFLPQLRAVWYKHRVEHMAMMQMPTCRWRSGDPPQWWWVPEGARRCRAGAKVVPRWCRGGARFLAYVSLCWGWVMPWWCQVMPGW